MFHLHTKYNARGIFRNYFLYHFLTMSSKFGILTHNVYGIWNKYIFFIMGGGEVMQSVKRYLFQPSRLPSRYRCSAKTSCPAPVLVYPAVWPSTLVFTLYVSCSQLRTQRHCLTLTGFSLGPEMWVVPSIRRLIGALAKLMRFCWQCFRLLS